MIARLRRLARRIGGRPRPPSDAELVAASGLFDAAWYRGHAPDLADEPDSLAHYLSQGAAKGYRPNPAFDPKLYLETNPDVAAARLDPLVHYLRAGRAEGRPQPVPARYATATRIADGGVFDSGWYLARFGAPIFGLTPAEHYLTRNGQSPPGPLFDAAWYRAAHPDSAAHDPLVHWTEWGRLENRQTRNIGHAAIGPGKTLAVSLPAEFAQPGRIAVVVHAFYPHLFAGIWARLARLPGPFTLLVGVPDAAGQVVVLDAVRGSPARSRSTFHSNPVVAGLDPATHAPGRQRLSAQESASFAPPGPQQLDRVGGRVKPGHDEWDDLAIAPGTNRADVTLDCRIVPNRGRNFGTLFAEFASEVSRHDFVLHLHTKQSLYTGAEQAAWRDLLLDGLVGSPALAGIVYALFADDPQIGLVYPEISPQMPYWAHHWLSNAHQGQVLMSRLGIEDFPRGGHFDYPVGGMFWARVEAIRPLLDAGFAHDDFPPESGQNDGTLAHAIERAVGLVARARGFRFVTYERDTGIFRDDWSHRNMDQYLTNSAAAFAGLLDGAEVISFDIFDTVLTRRSLEADSVLRYVGHRLGLRFAAGREFFARRKAAEYAAREGRGFGGDVDRNEIYAAFPATAEWTPARIAEAAALERETDAATLCARRDLPGLVAAARAAGKRVIAVSDTYYTRSDIAALLGRAGLGDAFDALYLSSAERARKDRGDLWDIVTAREAVAPARWLHVGDNEHSDIQAACDRGMRYFHTMHPARLLEQFGYRPGAPSWQSDLVLGPAMQHLAGSPFLDGAFRPRSLGSARNLGYAVFGPLMFLFASWLARHPALRTCRRLHFLAREGQFLLRLYDMVRARAPMLGLPPGSYFHVSRRAVLSAIQAVDFAPERIVQGAGFTGTLDALLRHRIGFTPPACREAILRLPDDEDAVLSTLRDLRDPIVAHAGSEHANLMAYAGQSGMGDGSALVDIGYRATVQTCLQELLNIPLTGFYLGTLDAAGEVEGQGGRAFGCLCEGVASWPDDAPALRHSLLLEAFLTAPHGQVETFVEQNGQIAPTFRPPTITRAEAAILEQMHDGAIAYCTELLDIYGPDLLLAHVPPRQPQEPFRMLVHGELTVPPDVARALRTEDEFCGRGEVAALPIAE